MVNDSILETFLADNLIDRLMLMMQLKKCSWNAIHDEFRFVIVVKYPGPGYLCVNQILTTFSGLHS
ncbi:CLUMA_CG020441, isoform A [Clunio marinus]|uniref:CLUMA_CG020441, isoform A n=1 Tax=Clunio marinus TaxID=568069 RepID=A0A1J1J906_9DIPT|nr:CLUMA_CG020441, isoform A [Clunio marinus]